jgi:hypothetical protein
MIPAHQCRLSAMRAVILAVGLLAVAAPVAAQQNNIPTATLSVSGSVPGISQIFVENVSGNTGFDLTLTQGITQIATIRERSNKKSGYKVMVTSANLDAGNCTTNTKACFYNSTELEDLAFDIYKGTSTSGLILAASPSVNSGNWTTSSTKTTGQGISNAAKVSFTGDPDLSEGSYNETLTFTITANP